ncbi:putative omega-hydroxypalmitate O-feruloyl transferase [Arabidopsis thaliana]|uniref:F21B7.2 n=4 Tax=Arabidopsis TaxID=3701 RepID=Q9LR83_ARATH|nr:HXXXD-type acyl-transferase family protein [Arabidopsis thaliana]KAG7595682.1 Transferase [Arabidopsis suecica]KAG7644928.1 Transferase [Arabidopsis thaliana x Arabidopsis arenosa]AAF86541.1 F21B7.2 [Arabidopsis thaliana]AAY78602.1 transferase family protein [Arabidopsis thaliana]AEE27567.1 HXXXD-type acyl-transferase family protein [Arabidopsis thaliana]|eukprot:NP_171838.1 HXXXD-type acyl-transferase family protein [Arabidopsis thaliana]
MASCIQELHFTHLHIPVTINQQFLVHPSSPTPANQSPHHSLYLSNLDDIIGARVFTPSVYFYPSTNNRESFVLKRLQDALSEVLVPYYPLSGRLREVENGKLEVFFGEEQGVLMVSANSSMDLADLGDLTVPNPAWLPLIFRNPGEEAYKILEMPLLIAQVTFFTCGGFSLGIRLCHCICDGFGAMQFLGSWAATAKTGKLIADPEPVWDRETFKPRNPPMVKYPHHEYLPIEERSNLTNSLWDTKPLQKCYRISKEFQCRVKSIAQGEDPTLVCSTFDAMAAHIWRSWVKALDVKPLDYNLRLTFSVNVRTRLETLKLRKGFYGNVVCLACAMSSVESLINDSLSKTTRLVQDARLRVSEDYLRSMVDYVDVKRPKRLEFGGKLTITQWTRFEMYETADFGWGKPVYAGPIDLRPTPQVCVLLPQGGVESGNDQSMVVCLCLPPTAVHTFTRLLSLNDHK